MKKVGMIAAACAVVWGAAPAEAKLFDVRVTGIVNGLTETFNCTGPMTQSCFSPFTRGVDLSFTNLDLAEGANSFTYGYYLSGAGETDFTIIRSGDFLMGGPLSYSFKSCSGIPGPGCYAQYGSSPTSNVSGGVPEPATWAMMIAGFAAMGRVMRRRLSRVAFA